MALPVVVELFYDGQWNDVTCQVRGAPALDGQIRIQRGFRTPFAPRVDPGVCELALNNRDGTFSPRNPRSPLYGKIGRNTPLRVRVGDDVRFTGEVSQWPQKWIGDAVWAPIEASGLLRRLSTNGPLEDAVHRLTQVYGPPDGYLPLDDPAGSTSGRGLYNFMRAGGSRAQWGRGELAPYLPPCVLTAQTTGRLFANMREGFITTPDWTLDLGYRSTDPATWGDNTPQVFSLQVVTANRLESVEVGYELEIATTGAITIRIRDLATNTVIASDTASTALNDGRLHHIRLTAEHAGGTNATWTAIIDGQSVADATGNVGSSELAAVVRLIVDWTASDSAVEPVNFGQIILWLSATAPTTAQALAAYRGHVGELAADRFTRLCAEHGITATVVGTAADSAPMGAQYAVPLVDLLDEIAAADLGILHETRDQLGLTYRTRASLYHQQPVELDYSTGDVHEPFGPVEDDKDLANQVTVRLKGGGSYTVRRSEGPLSVQPQPDGVGLYDKSFEVNLRSDHLLPDHAGWRLHLGTVDEMRWPAISVNLARLTREGRTALVDDVAGLEIAGRLTVSNLPDHLPPEPADQLILGYTETIDTNTWHWQAHGIPAAPYAPLVWQTDGVEPDPDAPARFDTDGAQTFAAFTAGVDVSLDVLTTRGPLWTTNPADLPLQVRVAGVTLNVTAVTDSVTDTFSRTVSNGWGTTDTGETWVVIEGAASGASVGSGVGTLAAGTSLIVGYGDYEDVELLAKITPGMGADASLLARITDQGGGDIGYYEVALQPDDGHIGVWVRDDSMGSYSLVATYDVTINPGTAYWLRVRVRGFHITAKLWVDGAPEPDTWHLTYEDIEEHVTAGRVGCAAFFGTVTFDDFAVVNPQRFTVDQAPANGIHKTIPAGSPLRLATPAPFAL